MLVFVGRIRTGGVVSVDGRIPTRFRPLDIRLYRSTRVGGDFSGGMKQTKSSCVYHRFIIDGVDTPWQR